MTAPDLPAELKAALDAKLHGLSRSDGRAFRKISETYRAGGGSGAIRSEADALAYALARMPATYAAVAASLNALREVRARLRAQKACSMSAPDRERRRGPRRKRLRRWMVLIWLTPTLRCARWRWIWFATAHASPASDTRTAKPAPRWRMQTLPTSSSQAIWSARWATPNER